jgi:hypothetical protein
MAHESANSKLKVMVRIDSNLETARIEVRGIVTPENLRALYVVARRTSAMLPGREIVLDLTKARAAVEAIALLHDQEQLSRLTTDGTSNKPCRLRVMDPVATHSRIESTHHAERVHGAEKVHGAARAHAPASGARGHRLRV